MNKKLIHLLPRAATGLAALLVLLGGTAAFAAPVGFVTSLEGIAQIQPANTSNWQPAAMNGEVSVGDSVRTERGAEVEIRLVDDTVLTVYEETDLYIDRMIVGDLATKERSILREIQGRVRAKVGKAFGGTTRLEIHTPTAIVGVRGSTMDVAYNAQTQTTTATIVEGTGFAKANGQTVELTGGEQSVIPKGEAPGAAEPAKMDATTAAGQETAASGSDAPQPDMDIDELLFGEGGVAASGELAVGQSETLALELQTLNQGFDAIQTADDSQRVTGNSQENARIDPTSNLRLPPTPTPTPPPPPPPPPLIVDPRITPGPSGPIGIGIGITPGN